MIGGPDPLGPMIVRKNMLKEERTWVDLSIWHWLIVLLVVVLIFGTKKLRNIGQDLGGAVKGFKEGMKTPEGRALRRRADAQPPAQSPGKTIDAEVKKDPTQGLARSRRAWPGSRPARHAVRIAGRARCASARIPCSTSASPKSSSSPSSR